MTFFRTTIEIHAAPEQIWPVLCDFERWPKWTPTMTHLRRLDPGPLSVGSRLLIRQPRLRPAEWRVVALDADKNLTTISLSPGIRVTAHHRIAPVAEGSVVTLSTEFSGLFGPVIGHLMRRLNTHYLALEAAGLKQWCEAK